MLVWRLSRISIASVARFRIAPEPISSSTQSPELKNAERVVTQTGLVVLPDGGKTFVEARERMIGLGLDQFAEPL